MKYISLIGATGSIGKQTVEVVKRHPDEFQIVSMVANNSSEEFLRLVKEVRPKYCALVNEEAGKRINDEIPSGVEFAFGRQNALDGVLYGDTAVVSASGFAGLEYSLKAIENGKNLALANKETLVCGGDFVMDKVRKSGINLMPVDSEHSAIWQALGFNLNAEFENLIITASGGPFYSYTEEQLKTVTPKDALKHPTWNMGAKITIDSATLLNKGFEVIEAHHLYNAPYERIKTVVQPESIIHSLVEFRDGGVLAQLSNPSMSLPIQLALTYPKRLACGVTPLDFSKLSAIRFLPLEREKFPCYDLALKSAEQGGIYSCALNGAGEIAVRAFLQERIKFTDISKIIENTLSAFEYGKADCFEVLAKTDEKARRIATEQISKFSK